MIFCFALVRALQRSKMGRRYVDHIILLVSTFVGKDYAAEVVVTGKGSPHIVYTLR